MSKKPYVRSKKAQESSLKKWVMEDPKKELLTFLQDVYRRSKNLNSVDVIKVLIVNTKSGRYAEAIQALTREEVNEVIYEFVLWLVHFSQPLVEEQACQQLKVSHESFEAIRKREKRFEIRRNDRGYQVGDYLMLNEFDEVNDIYSGRWLQAKITYISYYGQQEGFVVLGIEVADTK